MSFRKTIATIAILIVFPLLGCGSDQAVDSPASPVAPAITGKAALKPGCQSCHPYRLTGNHATLTCVSCHGGDNQTNDFSSAHISLTAHPAHPALMQDKCGRCHHQTTSAKTSRHFTVSNEINQIRRHFGADHDLATLQDIPVIVSPTTPLQLVDDLLRRRCLRCHVYYEGDGYSRISRGVGCAACHLEYQNGELVSHNFIAKPTDSQCLSCHYGNRVGSDYYGRFDHDFKQEYRTPYQPDGSYAPRPYAVEQHNLSPDIHQQAGMTCIDCHLTMHEGNTMTTISCENCHLHRATQPPPASHLKAEAGQLVVTTRQAGLRIVVPSASNPVHREYQDKAACTVCHARWSFNDQNINLLRIDHEDYEEWDELFVQESSEAEVFLLNGIYGDELLVPVMTDKITGQKRPGLWLKGFRTRRWETPIIAADRQGRLQVMRPVLDLHLSWVDEEGETGFDSIVGNDAGLRPYTPHTIGKAGAFYRQRLVRKDTSTPKE